MLQKAEKKAKREQYQKLGAKHNEITQNTIKK
jgi:hypothetical protein